MKYCIKFEFFSFEIFNLEFLKLFFDNWKNRDPMLIKLDSRNLYSHQLKDLVEKYKEKGIIKKYSFGTLDSKSFEWI